MTAASFVTLTYWLVFCAVAVYLVWRIHKLHERRARIRRMRERRQRRAWLDARPPRRWET